MNCNIQPYAGRILIMFTKADQERMSAGGLYIGKETREKLLQALVVNVADDVTGIHPGDVVLAHFNEGFDIRSNEKDAQGRIIAGDLMRFIPSTGVYGIIHPPTPDDSAAIDCANGASPLDRPMHDAAAH